MGNIVNFKRKSDLDFSLNKNLKDNIYLQSVFIDALEEAGYDASKEGLKKFQEDINVYANGIPTWEDLETLIGVFDPDTKAKVLEKMKEIEDKNSNRETTLILLWLAFFFFFFVWGFIDVWRTILGLIFH